MRTSDEYLDEGQGTRPIGEGVATDDVGTLEESVVEDSTSREDETELDPTTDSSETTGGLDDDGGFGTGDTTDVSEATSDLTDEEAEEMALDVMDDIYGREQAEAILDDLETNLGLGPHEVLDIILGNGASTDGFGEGVEEAGGDLSEPEGSIDAGGDDPFEPPEVPEMPEMPEAPELEVDDGGFGLQSLSEAAADAAGAVGEGHDGDSGDDLNDLIDG